MNALELAYNQLTHVIGENNNGEEVVITLRKPLYPESFVCKQQAEIEALKDMLEEEGIGVSQKYLNERIAELGKAQEK